MHTDSTLRVNKLSQIDARLTRDNTQNATFECDHTLIEECLHMQQSGQGVDIYVRCTWTCTPNKVPDGVLRYALGLSHAPQNSENAFFTLG